MLTQAPFNRSVGERSTGYSREPLDVGEVAKKLREDMFGKPAGTAPSFDYEPSIPAPPPIQLPTMGPAPTLEIPAAPGTPGGAELPTIDMPEMRTAQFQAPEWSEQAITSLAQRKAAPGVRGLKEGLREMTAMQGNDPISRHNSREAMKGYGAGLGQVMAGAHSAAVQEYSQRYGYEFQGAAMQFEAEGDAIAREFQGKLATNMAQYEGKLQGIMAGYQAQVAGASLEYQSAFNMMMRQYEIESQASMLKYETESHRQELQVELEFKSASIDFDAKMKEYELGYEEQKEKEWRPQTEFERSWSALFGTRGTRPSERGGI